MKTGDLIFDFDRGMTGIILDVMEECAALGNLPVIAHYYEVMYDDGAVDTVRDLEVKPLEED